MKIVNDFKMNYDENLFFNFIPIISAATCTLVTCITIIFRIKNRWPVKVNCWFCNCTSKVARQTLDWWFCIHCEQYNGFSEDGDYNYDIPEQHRLNKNAVNQSSYCEKKPFLQSYNSLCKQCNKREELKLSKLREVENSTDEFNAKIIEGFEKSFEKEYPLCMRCQNTVQNVLYKQMLWLTQYKMLFFKQKPIKRMIANQEWIERILRVILSILASVAIGFTEVWYLPLCGISLQIAVCVASPKGRKQSDIFPILGWICLICVRAFSTTAVLKLLNLSTNKEWLNDHDNAYQYFNITLGTAVGLSNLKLKTHKPISDTSLSFKKLESPSWSNSTSSRSPSPEPVSQFNGATVFREEKSRNFNSPVNITDALMTPTAIETPIPLKPISISQISQKENKTSLSSRLSSRADTEISFSKLSNAYSFNDSLINFNSLSLGNHSKMSSSQSSSKVFETKVYGTTSPDIFTRRLNSKRSILAPARLRSVTQTSWVAGGYWQSGMSDIPTLSRSSSQSSGFGSSGSVYGVSPEPSLHDFDQCSVVSDSCYFARPESPLTIQNSAATRQRNNNFSPKCDESLQCHMRNDIQQCTGHTTTTIVNNPIWLSVLLCGSLVFNMMVLTTILLR